jgi:hypothetical protein
MQNCLIKAAPWQYKGYSSKLFLKQIHSFMTIASVEKEYVVFMG